MRKTILAAAAVTTILSGAVLGNRAAEAMFMAAPAALGVAASQVAQVQKITNICGSSGCYQVQTSRPRPHKTHP